MRGVVRAPSLLLIVALSAPMVAEELAIRGDGRALDRDAAEFVRKFIGGASDLPDAAAAANLRATAAYLRATEDRDRERLWKDASRERLIVISRGERREIGVAAAEQKWLDYLAGHLEDFETTMPGYQSSWRDTGAPAGRFVAADILWRNGTSLSHGTYLPFDASLRPEVGRSYIFWMNLIEQSWFDRQLYPAARVAFADRTLRELRAEGLSAWYATRFMMYRVGADAVGGKPVRESIGDLYDSLLIAKADVLAPLATQWLAAERKRARASIEDDAVAAAVMALYALADVRRGSAPPPHERASILVIGWLHENKALKRDDQGKWSIDRRRLMPALRSLAAELLRVEASRDRTLVARLFESHPLPPGMEETIAAMAAVSRPKVTGRLEPRLR
jgi:hypothetical protein